MLAYQIKTASHLKAFVENAGTSPHYFTRDTMRFFGDTMRNYGVRQCRVDGVLAFELYRRRPVKNGMSASAYFDAKTFKRIHVSGESVVTL